MRQPHAPLRPRPSRSVGPPPKSHAMRTATRPCGWSRPRRARRSSAWSCPLSSSAGFALDLCVHTRLPSVRTRDTGRASRWRDASVPIDVEPAPGRGSHVGDLEGKTIDDYRRGKSAHVAATRFRGGESLDAHGATPWPTSGCSLGPRAEPRVCHDIPVRYAVNAASRLAPTSTGPYTTLRTASPVPLRRGRARTRGTGDPPQRADSPFLDCRRLAAAASTAWVFQTLFSPLCM